MTESLGDVFVRLAHKTLAGPEECRSFMKAARVVLRLDPELKRLPKDRRAKLHSKPAVMTQAIRRVVADAQVAGPKPDSLLMRRVLAAYIVAKGLSPIQDKGILNQATLLLQRLADDVQKDYGGTGGRQRVTVESTADRAFAKQLRREAAALRKRAPHLNKMDRARNIMRICPRKPCKWPSPKALIEWAKRHRIQI